MEVEAREEEKYLRDIAMDDLYIEDEDIKYYEECIRENLYPEYYINNREINEYIDKFEKVYDAYMEEEARKEEKRFRT